MRCPEPDQPDVMPGPWAYTDLETQSPLTLLEIKGLRLFMENGGVLRSGRQYTCDEFPPASWIEGGDGPGRPATANGDSGGSEANTYCAPAGQSGTCRHPHPYRVRSEQDWQGVIHSTLGRRLRILIKNEFGLAQFESNDAARFRLSLVNHPGIGPARVYWRDDDDHEHGEDVIATSISSPSRIREILASGQVLSEADYKAMGYVFDEVVIVNDTETFVHLAGEGLVPASLMELQLEGIGRSDDKMTMTAAATEPSHTSVRNLMGLGPQGNLTASDVDESLARYSRVTQQEPTGNRTDILAVGTEYTIGQLRKGYNTTQNRTLAWSQSKNGPGSGPVQCSPQSSCLDGSCCNSEGKCGFQEGQ